MNSLPFSFLAVGLCGFFIYQKACKKEAPPTIFHAAHAHIQINEKGMPIDYYDSTGKEITLGRTGEIDNVSFSTSLLSTSTPHDTIQAYRTNKEQAFVPIHLKARLIDNKFYLYENADTMAQSAADRTDRNIYLRDDKGSMLRTTLMF